MHEGVAQLDKIGLGMVNEETSKRIDKFKLLVNASDLAADNGSRWCSKTTITSALQQSNTDRASKRIQQKRVGTWKAAKALKHLRQTTGLGSCPTRDVVFDLYLHARRLPSLAPDKCIELLSIGQWGSERYLKNTALFEPREVASLSLLVIEKEL
ncbi:hypothetical protein BD410DRAFT_885881 [Rickenella mellea]|uniref:Uncharacterized protein n=1 Tax=Rickenella mellea TaxID=50990 RepID=A0A4Y7PQ77_9AGAM|nr:hypothetical protein BD410DRAFT_885881 [Rickenella mellea]